MTPHSRRKPPLWLKPIAHAHAGGDWFKSGPLRLLVCFSTDAGDLHMSISNPERYPAWDEIVTVWRWYAGPDREGVIVIPRAHQHVNLHPNCFHVWESRCRQEGGR